MILIPKSFGTFNFGAISGAYPEEMDISSGIAQLKIEKTAGGRLIDFNYGTRAQIVPQPFVVTLLLSAATQTALANLYESLANSAALQGIVGENKTFTAQSISGNNWTCNASCESVVKVIRADDSIDKNTLLAGVQLQFVPVTNWIEV